MVFKRVKHLLILQTKYEKLRKHNWSKSRISTTKELFCLVSENKLQTSLQDYTIPENINYCLIVRNSTETPLQIDTLFSEQ